MTARVLRLAPAVEGRRVVEVSIGPGELPDAVRLRDRLSRLPSVQSGRRTVEIVAVAGDAA